MSAPADDRLDLLAELLARGRRVAVRARGGSMRPALHDGDVITLAPLARPPLPGEVIAVRRGDRFAIHRVEACEPGGVRLRGDACAAGDGLFAGAEVLGRAVAARRGRRPLGGFRLGGSGGRALLAARPLTRALLRALGALARFGGTSDQGSIPG